MGEPIYMIDGLFLINVHQVPGGTHMAYRATYIRRLSKKKRHACKTCSMVNEYAESNQSDGSYICYNCR
mgnify:CR=1 FL=1